MPSPFPGMDPYLEDPAGWLDLHNRLITYLSDDLNEALAGRYVARAGERVIVESEGERVRGILPDVYLIRGPEAGAGTRLAEVEAPFKVKVALGEFREAFLELRDRHGKVVTVIEILSPSNKEPGSDGREQYSKKQREVLSSDANLVEIDLLRRGAWTVAIPRTATKRLRPFDYLVCVSRGGDRELFELYPIRLRDALARIALPLAAGDKDVAVDLRSLLDRGYDRGQYALTLDYSRRPPPPRLKPRDASWCQGVLRGAGRRGA